MSHASSKKRPQGRGAAAPRLDAANLAGITTLMNPQNIKQGINLDDAEKTIMGKTPGAGGKKADIDPVHLYTAELGRLADELGIDLLDDGTTMREKDPLMPSRRGARAPSPAAAGRREAHALSPATAPAGHFSARNDPLISTGPPRGGSSARASKTPKSRIDDLIDDLDFGGPPRKSARETPAGHSHGRGRGRSRSRSSSPSGSDSGGSNGSSAISSASGSSASDDDEEEECDCDSECESDCECDCHEEECDCDSECESDCECACHSDDDSDAASGSEYSSGSGSGSGDDERVDDIISRLESDLGIQTDGKRERRRHKLHRDAGATFEPRRHRHGGEESFTNEQERRRHINSVVSEIRGETRTSFGVERERVENLKTSKLERISQLRQTLEEEGIDCSKAGNPTTESSMEEIDGVLNILSLKNDRNRFSSLAEEIILGGAEGIESVFDGTRKIPLVGWQPDYTGYHATVNVKLHRMRYETGQVVGEIIEKYNIGPKARIFLELLPSFFLYPRQQRRQRGAPGLAGDPRVADARGAMSAIHTSSTARSLADVQEI